MAGQPIIRGHLKTLEDVGEEAIINMVLEGETVRSIIQTLGVGMRGWYKWMDLEEGRRDRFDLARQMRAEALDQEGLDLVDNCDPDRDEIQLTKLRWSNADTSPVSSTGAGGRSRRPRST
jgi:transposase